MYQPKQPKDIRCPLEYALELFGGRWKSRILCLLYNQQSLRYGAVKKLLGSVSDTVLAGALKELIRDGLITREQYAEIPPRVEYALSSRGRELVPYLRNICLWANQYHSFQEPDSEPGHCRSCAVRRAMEKPSPAVCLRLAQEKAPAGEYDPQQHAASSTQTSDSNLPADMS